jgi:hypothetical protein
MTWFMAAPVEFPQLSRTVGLQLFRHGRASGNGLEMNARHGVRHFHATRQSRAALH